MGEIVDLEKYRQERRQREARRNRRRSQGVRTQAEQPASAAKPHGTTGSRGASRGEGESLPPRKDDPARE
ncbi:MAG: hypothetical protein D6826_06010 [Alphaproteobacteria bacterium]|nr:MAG: hypothetical protein D6826_06010 [Alphaproteobacteria bacterium]